MHGTDTMAFTAAALSFLLEDLGKPVVLTGSQIPLQEQRSDGVENLLGALIIAGHFAIPEVTIFFRSVLTRGNRSWKSAKTACGIRLSGRSQKVWPRAAETDVALTIEECRSV